MDILDIINSFNPIFITKYLYTIQQLRDNDTIILPTLKESEYQFLKEIGDKTTIELIENDDAVKVLLYLQKFQKNNKVIITLQNKEKFNQDLFADDLDYSNIFVKVNLHSKPIPLTQYIYNEQILYDMIKEAKDYSPLEKFIYVYDIIKKLKEYQENDQDKHLSRVLYEIIYNNYIVCSGFTELQRDLLTKLNIPCYTESVIIGMSAIEAKSKLSKIKNWNTLSSAFKYRLIRRQMQNIPQTFGHHSRLITYIDDPKYQINGIYFNDVTFDNDLIKNLYNHLLLTQREISSSNNKIKLSFNSTELLYADNIQEFYDKINYMLKHKNEEPNVLADKDDEECLNIIISNLIDLLDHLDPKFINEIVSKYNISDNKPELIFQLGSYIVKKVNNHIDEKNLLRAINIIYQNAFENGLTDGEIKQIIQDNNEANTIEFGHIKFK